jgi:serine/threonine protein kinase
MDPEQQRDPNLGRSWGDDFRVERKLGAGGMGAVYLLRNVKIPSSVLAMKILHAGTSHAVTERFQQEARVASEVASHRVVKPLTYGQFADGAWYIVMEYVDGRSLADELYQAGPLPAATALKIALRVADTMKEAHAKGIIHRDLKPPNLMLTSEGRSHHHVKVLDFGVARASGAMRVASTDNRMIVGTTGYMSPEAAIGLGVDGRTDVFSLGVVLFEMLTGALPIPVPRAGGGDEEFKAWVLELLKKRAPLVSARRPARAGAVPAAVDAVVERALAGEAAERFDMAGFQSALEAALAQLEPGGGVVRSALATMLSISPPELYRPADAPTLSTPAGEVARLRAQLVTRAPADSAARDSARDSAAHDSAAHDSAARDSSAHDSAARDSSARDSSAHDSAARDSAARDSAARDSTARDSTARDSTARDSARDLARAWRPTWRPPSRRSWIWALAISVAVLSLALAVTWWTWHAASKPAPLPDPKPVTTPVAARPDSADTGRTGEEGAARPEPRAPAKRPRKPKARPSKHPPASPDGVIDPFGSD